MPTNKYFSLYNQQQNDVRLYEQLINEQIKTFGIDAFYMLRESQTSVDTLFGDDPTKMFNVAIPVEVYIQSFDSFEGGEMFSKFGLEVRKQARFLISKKAFQNNVGIEFLRPREGDILWLSNFKSFFEIKYVDEDQPFYLFGNPSMFAYSLMCEKWKYSQENVTTGIQDIDTMVNNMVSVYSFTMSSANSVGSYIVGEQVSQNTSNAYATVVGWNVTTNILELKNINGSFVANSNPIVGSTSNASYILYSDNTREDINNLLADNQDLVNESNVVIDWSESNPFGEPTKT